MARNPKARAKKVDEAKPVLEYVRSQSFISIYCNSAQLRVSPWDFMLILGEACPKADAQTVVEQKAAVSMSPQHTKALLSILTEHVKKYEEKYGEIRWQPSEPKV